MSLGEGVGVVPVPLGDPARAGVPVEGALRARAALDEAEDLGAERLFGVAEGEGAAVGGGGGAALLGGAVAEGA